MDFWVVRSKTVRTSAGQLAYWSAREAWVEIDRADGFSDREKAMFALPEDSEWVFEYRVE